MQPQPATLNQPGQIGFFGMNTYFTGLERIKYDGEDGIAYLVGLGRQAGVAWAREELSWGNVERHGKGRWEWDYFDRRLLQVAQSGYGIVGLLLTSPGWARVGDCAARINRYAAVGVNSQDFWCPPARPQDFADYVRATVERYDGDGVNDAPGSPRVTAWQIWNEPNHWETWPGSPAEYAAVLRAGYAAAKAADPTALVAVGGVYVFDGTWSDGIGHNDGLRFLDAVFAADPAAWRAFDTLAIHPFMPSVAPDEPGVIGKVTYWGRIITARDWLHNHTQRFGGTLRPLWISEVGWSVCTSAERDCYVATAQARVAGVDFQLDDWRLTVGSSGHPAAPVASLENVEAELTSFIGKSEDQQASYMVRAHALALALGVQHLSYFQFEDKFDGSARTFWEEASIVRPKGNGYQPRLAFGAYSVMSRQLAGVAFVGMGPLNRFNYNSTDRAAETRTHLRFRSFDNVIVDLLWRNRGVEEVTLPLEPGRSAELITRDGARRPLVAQAGAVRFSVGEQPLYLRQTAPPALVVRPTTLTVLAEPGKLLRPISIAIGNRGSGVITWSAASDAAWLSVMPSSGRTVGETATLTIDQSGLTLGAYNATLTITSDAGVQQIPIRLLVVPKVWEQFFPSVAR